MEKMMKKKWWLCWVLLWGMLAANAQESPLEKMLAKYRLSEISRQGFAAAALSARDCEMLAPILMDAWKEETYERLKTAETEKCLRRGSLAMRFEEREFGEVPQEGYSLYISLHGGGAAPQEVNDQQWQNQINLYRPAEGIYVAPRAPWNDWDMWFKPALDDMLEDLIQWMVVSREVNPNRVYLMGYSAGGDGVWRLAPRMADRWAAAAMMAGHPGNAQQVNLLNVPFMIWMGENDNAYNRSVEAVKKGAVMDSLENAEPLTYIHETHIVPGKGHWMDRADTAAVGWMANFERDPYPYHIVWQQEEVVRPAMYWLEVKPESARQGMRVEVLREDNQIEIVRCDYSWLRIYLNDEMMDLDRPVKVVKEGRVLFEGKLKRTLANMARTLAEKGDYNWMFPAYVDLQIP